MKTILITGGAGFIGSHVVREFVLKYPAYKIINLDALTYAGNLENLKDQIKFKIINKTKNFEYIGVLDEMARTPRIFSDSSDNIEIQFIGNIDDKSIMSIKELNEDIYNYDTGDSVDDGINIHSEEKSDDEYKDNLKDDFNKFGA